MWFHGLTPMEHPSLMGSRLVACASLNHQGVSATLSRCIGVSLSLLLLLASAFVLRTPIHLSHFRVPLRLNSPRAPQTHLIHPLSSLLIVRYIHTQPFLLGPFLPFPLTGQLLISVLPLLCPSSNLGYRTSQLQPVSSAVHLLLLCTVDLDDPILADHGTFQHSSPLPASIHLPNISLDPIWLGLHSTRPFTHFGMSKFCLYHCPNSALTISIRYWLGRVLGPSDSQGRPAGKRC
jgi:hypothetical protein